MLIKENQLIEATKQILRSEKNITITELRNRLKVTFCPQGDDLNILKNRNDLAFDQKVRNIVSHRETNGLAEFAEYRHPNLLISKIYGN